MTVKDKNSLRQRIFPLLLFAILVSACRAPDNNIDVTVAVTKSAIAPPNVREAFTPTATITPCTPSQVNMNTLADVDQIDGYRWSEDGESFYFRSGNNTWQYSIISQELTPIPSSEVVVTPTPSDIEQRFETILAETPTIRPGYFSLSPSRKKLIYWSDPNILKTPTMTPDPDPITIDGYDAATFDEREIFLLQEGVFKPIYIGKIKGAIQEGYWLPGEDRVILKMLDFSLYYFLWVVDIPSRSLIPLISTEDVSGARKFSLLDISPDGNWIIYQANHVSIMNINAREIRPLYAIPHIYRAFWLPDGKRILAQDIDSQDTFSLLLYELDTQNIIRIAFGLPCSGSIELIHVYEDRLTLANIIKRATPIAESQHSYWYEIEILNLCLDSGAAP